MYVPRGVGWGMEGSSPQADRNVTWKSRRWITCEVLCSLCFGAPTLEIERKEGGRLAGEGGGCSPSYQKRWRPAPYFHWGRVTLMQDAGTLPPQMQRWVARSRVISTLPVTYLQVHEYRSFHFYVRRLAMRLSFVSASTTRRPSTDTMKGVKCRCLLRQALRYFFFFSRSADSRHFSWVLDWYETAAVFTTHML